MPPPAAVHRDRRSNRLARGLLSLGVGPGTTVALLCCEEHSDDRMVAELAVAKTEAHQICVALDLGVDELRDRLLRVRPTVVLACSHGVTAWRTTGVACRVVGDETGVIWWKLLELRHSPAPLTGPGAALDLVS